MQQRLSRIVTLGGLVLILALTLVPSSGPQPTLDRCVSCGPTSSVDALLNVLLFLPLGIGLGLARVRFARAGLAMLALTIAVELLQLVIPGRDPSARDVIANAIGGMLGFAMGARAGALAAPEGPLALRLTVGGCVMWVATHALAIWAAGVSLPPSRYYGQRQAHLAQFDTFPGTLVDGTIGGIPVRSGPDPRLAAVRTAWDRDRALVATAMIVAGARATRRTAPVVSIFDGERREIFVLGQRGDALVYQVRSHTSDARLRPLLFTLPRVFPGAGPSLSAPGDTIAIIAARRPNGVHLSARVRSRVREGTLRIDPGLAWALWLPFEIGLGTPATSWWCALWLFMTVLPLGYWGARAVRTSPSVPRGVGAAAIIVGTLELGLNVLPRIADMAPTSGGEWLSVLLGLASGIGLAQLMWRYLRDEGRATLLAA